MLADDSQIVSAVSQLASLALPPIGGLIAILGGYILLIGPLNYLILKRLDRRELAWLTMPALIVVFARRGLRLRIALRGNRRDRQRGCRRPRRPGRHRGLRPGLRRASIPRAGRRTSSSSPAAPS